MFVIAGWKVVVRCCLLLCFGFGSGIVRNFEVTMFVLFQVGPGRFCVFAFIIVIFLFLSLVGLEKKNVAEYGFPPAQTARLQTLNRSGQSQNRKV